MPENDVISFNRYLYTGMMPSPLATSTSKDTGGMIPVFYFLNATHTESAFNLCFQKFYNDVKKVQSSIPLYKNCYTVPRQFISDMSLVIFRPCCGK